MTDEHDRLFNYLSARVSNRESSAIALMGITASSSLVFLGLVFEKLTPAFWEFFFIGLLFPSLAFTYNEITNRGIHKDDQKIINDLIKDTDKEKWEKVIENIVINKKNRRARLFLMRFCLLSPSLGWLLILPIHFNLDLVSKTAWDIAILMSVMLVSFLIAYTNKIKH